MRLRSWPRSASTTARREPSARAIPGAQGLGTEEVEVGPEVGLLDGAVIQPLVAAGRRWPGRSPLGPAPLEFRGLDQQVQGAPVHVQSDAVACAHEPERPTGRSL